MEKLYRIRSPFTVWENGTPVPYNDPKVIYAEDHPVVRRNPGAFEEVTVVRAPERHVPTAKQKRRVETATAEPGEQR